MNRNTSIFILLLLWPLLLGSTTAAGAEQESTQSPAGSTAPLGRSQPAAWISAAVAIVPGVGLHGAGLFTAGDRKTALRLFGAEGIGLGAAAAGVVPLILTDASGQNLDMTVLLIAAGLGFLVTSWFADIYGAATGGRENARSKVRQPNIESYLGYAFVYDPQFAYRHFGVLRADLRIGRFSAIPEVWSALNDDNQRTGMDAAVRLLGPRPDKNGVDGSFLDFQIGAKYHRFGSDGFSILTAELLLPMRLDLVRLGRSLAGSFVDFDIGYAFQFFDYEEPGLGLGTDINGLILLRFGFGIYLGNETGPRGEALLYYDHRHDGFAGGLAVSLHEPNFLGHCGLSGKAVFKKGWGFKFDFQIGSAVVATAGLLYQWSGRP